MTRAILGAGVIWAGYVLLLWLVPWGAPDPDLPNVAARLGYDIDLAYLLIAGWTVLAALGAAVFLGRPQEAPGRGVPMPGPGPVLRWLERGAVGAAALAFHWPGSLARFGPHIEDVYFFNVLWRMVCGGVPYADFEFLYGPLMLAPVWAAISAFGFSMEVYFSVYAVSQVLFYMVLMAILQRFIGPAWKRYGAFLLLLPFVIDLLYGMNWIAWRYFAVVLVILLLASRPRAFFAVLGAGVLLGLQGAYSYEYGIAGLLAGLSVLGLGLFEPGRARAVAMMALLTATGLVVWALVALALTGPHFGTYLDTTAQVASEASARGLGRFAFLWTIQSGALFALLSLVVVLGALGLRRLGRIPASLGDRHLIGALAFTLITLKIGFQRVDYLHMAVPFVPLLLVLLLGAPRRILAGPRGLPQVMVGVMLVAALAQVVGHIPQGRWVVLGSVRGLVHEITNRPTVGPIEARDASIHAARSLPNAQTVDMAARLAQPDTADRPVLFYGQIWAMAPEVAACPLGYSFYDILYLNDRRPLAQIIAETPEALVVINDEDYRDIFEGVPQPEDGPPTGYRKLAQWVASPHYTQSPIETVIEADMWRAAIGADLARDFRVMDRVGSLYLLERAR